MGDTEHMAITSSSLLIRRRLTRCILMTSRCRKLLGLLIVATAGMSWLALTVFKFSDKIEDGVRAVPFEQVVHHPPSIRKGEQKDRRPNDDESVVVTRRGVPAGAAQHIFKHEQRNERQVGRELGGKDQEVKPQQGSHWDIDLDGVESDTGGGGVVRGRNHLSKQPSVSELQGGKLPLNFVADKPPSAPTPPLIVWWDPIPGNKFHDETVNCGEIQCRKTTDRSRWNGEDIVMLAFYGCVISMSEMPVPRRGTDLWSLINDESPKNLDYLLCHRSFLELFNYTSTYSRTSDFPFPLQWLFREEDITDKKYYVSVSEKTRLRTLPDPDQRLSPVIYVQSDCRTPSDRDHYVTLLQKYVSVDSYGPCINNRKFPDFASLAFDQGNMAPMISEDFYRFVARYKFALAMENAAAPDYVTEKFWRPIHLGVVPIVFGASNIRDFLPSNNSALIIDEFTTVEDLARAIQYYDQDEVAYESLLTHKTKGHITNPALLRLIEERRKPAQLKHIFGDRRSSDERSNLWQDYDCFLCQKLHDAHNAPRSAGDGRPIPKATNHLAECPRPGRFNDTGKYVIDDVSEKSWGRVWKYSEWMTCLMRRLIREGKRVTQKEFDQTVRGMADNKLYRDDCWL